MKRTYEVLIHLELESKIMYNNFILAVDLSLGKHSVSSFSLIIRSGILLHIC